MSLDKSQHRWNLNSEKQELEKRLAEIAAEQEILWKEAAENLLRFKCTYEDDWTVVTGINRNLQSCSPVDRKNIGYWSFVNNVMTGDDKKNYGEFIFYNPIFFREIEFEQIFYSRPKFLAQNGEKYFAVLLNRETI